MDTLFYGNAMVFAALFSYQAWCIPLDIDFEHRTINPEFPPGVFIPSPTPAPLPTYIAVHDLVHLYGHMFETPQDKGYSGCSKICKGSVCDVKCIRSITYSGSSPTTETDNSRCCNSIRTYVPNTNVIPHAGDAWYPLRFTVGSSEYYQWKYSVSCVDSTCWLRTCSKTSLSVPVVATTQSPDTSGFHSGYLLLDELKVIYATTEAYCKCIYWYE